MFHTLPFKRWRLYFYLLKFNWMGKGENLGIKVWFFYDSLIVKGIFCVCFLTCCVMVIQLFWGCYTLKIGRQQKYWTTFNYRANMGLIGSQCWHSHKEEPIDKQYMDANDGELNQRRSTISILFYQMSSPVLCNAEANLPWDIWCRH